MDTLLTHYDAIVLGAGAAGMFCAFTAARRGRSVLLVDHASRIGEKIRISGGGRCNFTNIDCGPQNFLSANPQFCISALSCYAPQDFIALVDSHGIAWHEKTRGQLFCDGSAQQIIDLLINECRAGGVEFKTATAVRGIERGTNGYALTSGEGIHQARSLVIATGGKSIPKIGATGVAYDIARQFELSVVAPRPGLVPLTFTPELLSSLASISGISLAAEVTNAEAHFNEALLFTHRGLSGPAVLQISSYWREGESISIDLAPGTPLGPWLIAAKRDTPKQQAANVLAALLPRRLAHAFVEMLAIDGLRLADLSDAVLRELGQRIKQWTVTPAGSEGYRKAEVTVGGVDTAGLDSRDMQARAVPGLFFIGEAVDVTGHLGGHNFQWAWSSGFAAGNAL